MKFTNLLAALAVTVSAAMPAAAADPELTVLDWAGFDIEGLYPTFPK